MWKNLQTYSGYKNILNHGMFSDIIYVTDVDTMLKSYTFDEFVVKYRMSKNN